MIWWERLPKSPLGDFWGEESPLNPPWGTLRMQHKIIFLVFFGTVGILFSAVTRVDRVPTLSINSQHPNNSDRIGISFAERCFCPPGATLLKVPLGETTFGLCQLGGFFPCNVSTTTPYLQKQQPNFQTISSVAAIHW